MKKFVVFIIAFLTSALLNINTAVSQIYVKVKPIAPVVVETRPASPGPDHIWVEPEWRWHKEKKNYIYVPGRWAHNKHHYKSYVVGHWDEGPLGYRWVPGHWER